MKIIFGDATELTVQRVYPYENYLKVLSLESPETLRQYFEDPVKTAHMTVKERGRTIGEYEGYTTFYRTEGYTGGIYGVVMYKPDRTPEVQAEVQVAAIQVAQIQAQGLTDEQALRCKAIYPAWEDVIGQTVALGFKFVHADILYKTLQDNLTIQEQHIPGEGTESLYAVLDETHAGTLEDPIPYNGNMELEEGKYYIQDETIYKCTRDTEIPVHQALADLIGIYVELSE